MAEMNGNVPSQRGLLVCLDSHSGTAQKPLPRWSYPRWRCLGMEQMNSTLLALEKLIPADTEHIHTQTHNDMSHLTKVYVYCLCLRGCSDKDIVHVTFLIHSGITLERFVLKSS